MTAISTQDLGFSYPGVTVFDRLNLHFEPGAVTAVTGPSGRGKSTLLYLLGLMLTPTCGEVRYGEVSVSGLRDSARSGLRARHVGLVFQDAALDQDRTVIDNVCEPAIYSGMPRSAAVARARELLERYGVEARWSHRPGEVSGGQAQRIALCRALLGQPRVVLADEPTGNLDDVAALAVLDGLRDAADQGATVVIATHDREVVARVDAVVDLGGEALA